MRYSPAGISKKFSQIVSEVLTQIHFEFGTQEKTIITKEYPADWHPGDEPYYPVNDDKNNDLYQQYKDLADQEGKVIFGGRLGMYKYFDMHMVISEALAMTKNTFC